MAYCKHCLYRYINYLYIYNYILYIKIPKIKSSNTTTTLT